MVSYFKTTEWDINHVWAVLLQFLQNYGKAKRSEINSILGNHLSDKQIRRYIDQLKARGLLKTEGERGQRVYLVGDSFKESTIIIQKALSIDMEELKKKGTI